MDRHWVPDSLVRPSLWPGPETELFHFILGRPINEELFIVTQSVHSCLRFKCFKLNSYMYPVPWLNYQLLLLPVWQGPGSCLGPEFGKADRPYNSIRKMSGWNLR